MKMKTLLAGAFVVLLAAAPNFALAYVGPGSGLSAVGTLVSLVGAVFLAIVGFVWYPIKRLLRLLRGGKAAVPPSDVEAP